MLLPGYTYLRRSMTQEASTFQETRHRVIEPGAPTVSGKCSGDTGAGLFAGHTNPTRQF
jgi:hypothetical protein